MSIVRAAFAILAGLATFAALEFVMGQSAKAVWPVYALAAPTRAYTVDMLIVRQAAGMLCTLAAGAMASWISRGDRPSVRLTGIAMLVIAIIWHVRIWDQYPVWYHLLLFAYLLPLTVLGGRLVAGHRNGDNA